MAEEEGENIFNEDRHIHVNLTQVEIKFIIIWELYGNCCVPKNNNAKY